MHHLMQGLTSKQCRQHLERPCPGNRHIKMRVGSINRHRVAAVDHLRGNIGMQIQADDDRNFRSNQLTYPSQQLALTILVVFDHHCAMQVQVNRVRRTGFTQRVTG